MPSLSEGWDIMKTDTEILMEQDKILSSLFPCQEYFCPECGQVVTIRAGQIAVDCRCGLPVFRPLKEQVKHG